MPLEAMLRPNNGSQPRSLTPFLSPRKGSGQCRSYRRARAAWSAISSASDWLSIKLPFDPFIGWEPYCDCMIKGWSDWKLPDLQRIFSQQSLAIFAGVEVEDVVHKL